jgi:hypothetical protein
MKRLRTLVWVYLFLLVFEGALRKWIVPALDAPLLLIRDPVVIWIYFEAWRNRLAFNNIFFASNLALAVSTALLASIFGIANILVTIYGLRTDFLQIPLIFLIPQILNRDDVIAMGKFACYMAIPIAAIVIVQFRSPPDSLINRGTMATHYGTVRPSGTFSFVTGLSSFFALTSAFLFYGFTQGRIYKIWLMALATCAILLASACSGSRTCIVEIGIVAVVAVLCVITRGKGGVGMLVAAALIAIAAAALSSLSVVQEGVGQLNQRIDDAGVVEGGTGGFVARFFDSMLGPLLTMDQVPLFGYGLGLGTNAAAGLFQTDQDLYWPEAEWDRLIFECGPVFGVLLCVFRAALTLAIAKRAYDAYRNDNILPMLIFASCGLLILNGQWGVPTILGFAIFCAGLTLAACEVPPEDDEEDHEHDDEQLEDESEHSPAAGTMD